MVVVTLSPSPQFSSKHSYTNNFLTFHQFINNSTKFIKPRNSPNGIIRAYVENSNPFSGFASKVLGSLPVIGLIARIMNDEGGLAGDIIDFAEFRRRVGNKCTITDSRAFYEFQDRRGRAGDPLYVLLCCWLAAVGAGLLKSEEILEGVARLSISNDIEFEEETFIAMMSEARTKRAKQRSPMQSIPMEVRVEKALDAIYVCCFDNVPIEEEDVKLMVIMLSSVFPTVKRPDLERMIKEKARKVEEGIGADEYPVKPKPLSKEAIQLQMKDLQFLKQNSTESLENKSKTSI